MLCKYCIDSDTKQVKIGDFIIGVAVVLPTVDDWLTAPNLGLLITGLIVLFISVTLMLAVVMPLLRKLLAQGT